MTTPIRNIHTDIHAALSIYEQTRFDNMQILTQAEYSDLYSYFAYKLPFMPAWGRSPSRQRLFYEETERTPSR